MKFTCPSCKGKFIGEADWVGLEGQCPHCGENITVPDGDVLEMSSPPKPPEVDAQRQAEFNKQADPSKEGAPQRSVTLDKILMDVGRVIKAGYIKVHKLLNEGKYREFLPKWWKVRYTVYAACTVAFIAFVFTMSALDISFGGSDSVERTYTSEPSGGYQLDPNVRRDMENYLREEYTKQYMQNRACYSCSGRGAISCPLCSGRGYRTTPNGNDLNCTQCAGRGLAACFNCKGSGRY